MLGEVVTPGRAFALLAGAVLALCWRQVRLQRRVLALEVRPRDSREIPLVMH